MTIRKILLIPLLISLLLFIIFSPNIYATAKLVREYVNFDTIFLTLVLVAIIVQFVGHYFRSKKASLLLSPIESSKVSTQFRAFSVGQLFNTILPLRVGELIRATILSQKLNISFGYSLLLIIFERSIDVFVIVFCVAVFMLVTSYISTGLVMLLISFTALAALGLSAVLVLKYQPSWFLKLSHFLTKQLNDLLKDKLRFKLWSVGYGLQKTLKRSILLPYAAYTAVAWILYLGSIFIIASLIFGLEPLVSLILSSIGPFVGISAPAGPAGLGTFSGIVDQFTRSFTGTSQDTVVFNIISWAVLVIPVSIAGAILLLKNTKEPVWKKRPATASDDSMVNKLSRQEDVSGELSTFLDNYFRGNDLSRIVDRLEQEGGFSLVKYFKGGSDAITILALEGKKRVVKKIIPIELKDRLKAQYDWLRQYGGGKVVGASREVTGGDYYSINIDFDKSNVPLYEYVHHISTEDAQGLLDEVWAELHDRVYGKIKPSKKNVSAVEQYIEKHIIQCLDKAMAVDEEIKKASLLDKITINGKEYDNLFVVLEKIKANKKAWADISTFRESRAVHGDVIIDNLLYSRDNKQVIIIDPAPDGNIINGPVFDFGKAVQSLHCGYEFLLRDEAPVTLFDDGSISFNESKSTQYTKLDEYTLGTLASKYLTEGERKAALFHGGVLYIRRLKHQVYYTPENALKFYAVGVRTLNEFLYQYE